MRSKTLNYNNVRISTIMKLDKIEAASERRKLLSPFASLGLVQFPSFGGSNFLPSGVALIF